MPTTEPRQKLVVWTENRALEEAKSLFAQFDAAFQTVPCNSQSRPSEAPVFVFYLPPGEKEAAVQQALASLRSCKASALVFYTSHPSSQFAFRIGTMVGKQKLPEAEWAFNLRHLKQILKARNIMVHPRHRHSSGAILDLSAVRHRLGMSQAQFAAALNVTTRTLQNWEAEKGTSQIYKKTRDIRELLSLMDDSVSAPKEEEWLTSPLAAFSGLTPCQLIEKGRTRDLIVEFERMREGQPI